MMRAPLQRRYLWLIAMLGAALIIALAMLGLDRAMRGQAMESTRDEATSQAAILAAGLESELNKFTLVPRVLAVDPGVAALLAGDTGQRGVLNRRLSALAQQTDAAAIYLMDAQGTTLAASNWNWPDSFIGSNYRFRDYFTGALRDGTDNEFALGTVSRRPGLYLAERVGPAARPLGVVAVKVEFDELESKWRNAEAGVFVTDADGIVLLSSNPAWRFRAAATGTTPSAQRDPARNAVRFGVREPERLILPTTGGIGARVRMVEKIQPIAPVGWDLHLLADPAPRLSAAIANGRLAGVVGLAALGPITAGLGHEIRQPLAAMRVYAESGERLLNAARHDEAAANFAKIAGLAGQIGAITEEQMHFSRRSAGEPRAITLAEVIDGSLLLLRDQIRQKGVTLTLPPPEAAATSVRARHVQLEQVLVNLLQNAVQACAPGGRIALTIATAPEAIHLSLSDDGPGVPADLRDTLFQPFVTSKQDGIGLGLAIAHDIMRQLGGDLVLEEIAEGARFTMVMSAS